jgi:hypothetical protein
MRLDSIEQINNQLQAGTIQSLNEQTLNQLRIRLNNKKSFNQAEQTLLYFIAMQCPYSGGAAVYTARSLYTVVNDTLDFMDQVLCDNEEWYFRKDEHTNGNMISNSIILYPNPAMQLVSVRGLEPNVNNTIRVFNSYGKEVLNVVTLQSIAELNIGELPVGVYYVKVQNTTVHLIKLVVIR